MVKVRERADGRKEIRETIDGERRSFYGKTNKGVRQKYREALAAPKKDDAPGFEPVRTLTVRDFFRQYDEVARDTMKRRSLETYGGIARKHLIPARTRKHQAKGSGPGEGSTGVQPQARRWLIPRPHTPDS